MLKPPSGNNFHNKNALRLAGVVGFEPTMLARQINSLLP